MALATSFRSSTLIGKFAVLFIYVLSVGCNQNESEITQSLKFEASDPISAKELFKEGDSAPIFELNVLQYQENDPPILRENRKLSEFFGKRFARQ